MALTTDLEFRGFKLDMVVRLTERKLRELKATSAVDREEGSFATQTRLTGGEGKLAYVEQVLVEFVAFLFTWQPAW